MNTLKINAKKIILSIIICLLIVVITRQLSFDAPKEEQEENFSISNVIENNDFSHLPYYNPNLLERYQAYQMATTELNVEDIVTHVNMNLDLGFYQETPILIENPDNLDVLVNKFYKLPDNWEPQNLVMVDEFTEQYLDERAANALQTFQDDCLREGFIITAFSGYRSTARQQKIYDNMVSIYGEEHTNKYVSRPGQSEHTTGLCVDIEINGIYYEDIESSPYYPWFREHLSDYGFILRYPEGKENLTGYHYESWHIRYLGEELAQKVTASGLTYDEYVARQ